MTEVEKKTPMTLSNEHKQTLGEYLLKQGLTDLSAESACMWASDALDTVLSILLKENVTTRGVHLKLHGDSGVQVIGNWRADEPKPAFCDYEPLRECVYILMNHIFPIMMARDVMQRDVRQCGCKYVCLFVKDDDTTAYFMFDQKP